MKNILIFTLISVIFIKVSFSNIGSADKTTEEICYQESLVDHKKYILPERWRDEWENFDWYQSCIDNIREVSPLSE